MGSNQSADELREMLAEYQDIVRRGDRNGFTRMFHPTATVSYPEGGQLVTVSAADFGREVADMVAAGEVVDEVTRHLEIVTAGEVAVMRVDFHLQLASDHYEGTDLYTLARLGGRWQITQKLYEMKAVP